MVDASPGTMTNRTSVKVHASVWDTLLELNEVDVALFGVVREDVLFVLGLAAPASLGVLQFAAQSHSNRLQRMVL